MICGGDRGSVDAQSYGGHTSSPPRQEEKKKKKKKRGQVGGWDQGERDSRSKGILWRPRGQKTEPAGREQRQDG